MEYGEEPHSAADKGIGLKVTWNYLLNMEFAYYVYCI